MNEYDVKRLALVLAVQAEIEAMKVNDVVMNSIGADPMHFTPQAKFEEKAMELRNLAYAHNDQL